MRPEYNICFILLCLLCSCLDNSNIQRDNEQAHLVLNIDPREAAEECYSNVFSKIDYIPIPSDSSFMIGEINKICVVNDHILLMDKYITRSVFVFSKDGKEKVQIHKQGQGPGEYVFMKDIHYDFKQKNIGIHCGIRKKILHYDMQGQYQSENTVPLYTTRVLPFPNRYVLYSDFIYQEKTDRSGWAPNIILTTEDGDVLSSANYFKKDVDCSVVYSSNPDFSLLNHNVASIKPDHSNVIYHVSQDSIYPAYRLHFGEYTLDSRYWSEAESNGASVEKVTEFCDERGLCESINMLEDNDYLFFRYKYKGNVNSVFYSKKTGKMIHINCFINDLNRIAGFYPMLLQDNKMYCVLNAENIVSGKPYLKEHNLLPSAILDSIGEFDNPVIVVLSLKAF